MNEITDMSPSTAVARSSEVSPLASTTQIEHNIAVQQASLLAKSDIVPAAYQGKPANCLIAIEYANRLGCSVLAVMQNLDIIHGRPSFRSTFLIGTVNATQRFTPIRFRYQGTEGQDDWGCRAAAKDRESGEECVGPLITIKLAKAEGWYSKKDKNGRETSKWQTIPELMLAYRAGAWWTRLYCPERTLGLHTTDEAEDIGPSAPSPRNHAAAVAAAMAAGDPDESPGPDYETVSEDPVASKYFTMLAERGMDSVEDRWAFEKRLHASTQVAQESSLDWNELDFKSAIAELEGIEVVQG
jgi:hypothetical protein